MSDKAKVLPFRTAKQREGDKKRKKAEEEIMKRSEKLHW
jgi:hypothetical protein